MNRYESSTIYRITSNDGHYYIGSTTQALSDRFNGHRKQARLFPERRVYQHLNATGWNATIQPIETLVCQNRAELCLRENTFVAAALTDPLCLNTNHAHTGMSREAYNKYHYQWKRDEILARRRERRALV